MSSYGLLSTFCCAPVAFVGAIGKGYVFLGARYQPLLGDVWARLRRVQNTVGHGNFNLVSFDDMMRYAKRYPSIGEFSRREIKFIEWCFYQDARRLGFLGEKVILEITASIPRSEVTKIPYSGHYLFNGKPLETFRQARAIAGENLVLTSGVRGIPKQIYLFLNKTRRTGGNLSRAARSIAPPGYSYHGISDFDIGQRGFGLANFTNAFSQTEIHHRLIDQGLIETRYPMGNPYGVRYEPWHIKITT